MTDWLLGLTLYAQVVDDACWKASESQVIRVSAAAYLVPVADAHAFGGWLSRRMEDIPITQAALARQAGVSQSQISRYRTGVTVPDPGTLRKLARPLDADFDEMMVLAGHRPGDEPKAARTFIVRTDDPKVHRLIRLAADIGSEVKPADLARIEAILDTFRRDR